MTLLTTWTHTVLFLLLLPLSLVTAAGPSPAAAADPNTRPSASGTSSSPSPFPSPSPPPSPAAALPPQYYIHFGLCNHRLQLQQYGNWIMTRPLSQQTGPGSILLYLDTRNMGPVAAAFGTITPQSFSLRHIYFGYHTTLGVKKWTPQLDAATYKETTSYYRVKVNGELLGTIRDLKDRGMKDPRTSMYSLKAALGDDIIKPSTVPYRIEILKACSTPATCALIPDPATVFVSPLGHVVWSIWTVDQPLTVNGVYYKDHGWCPVQTAINVA